ncbi:hypothetical protein [Streptomyces sp. NBC_00271]|uniref:hypothetical protein n=1 Tax=Streptomyces sp. NBC_00271 TaxID=2975697 RepID=UPI002E2CEFB9|nr:hypothetical protein [Streptomyces sp. NBC_00271]
MGSHRHHPRARGRRLCAGEEHDGRAHFSGGGSRDGLVTLADEGHKLQLGWPTALPEPRLDGDTATYAGVLPDVDLKLTALSSGYTSVLVVKTAEAAKNPALATIRMTVSGSGLDIAPTADGGFVSRDNNDTPVFESPAGRMWDSAGDTPATVTSPANVTTQLAHTTSSAEAETEGEPAAETTPLPAAGGEPTPSEGPGSGDAAAELPLKVNGTTLEITPDPALLHGADTAFPLYIDPPTKGIVLGDWTALASNGTKYWEFDGDKGVGHCSNYAGYLCSNSPCACTSSTRSRRSTARRSWTRRWRCTRRGRSRAMRTGTT